MLRPHADRMMDYRRRHPVRRLLSNARHRAKQRGEEFTIEELDLLPAPTHCPVFGFELIYAGFAKGVKHDPRLATLDRIDNSKGYVKGNVVIVSWRANNLKRDATLDELRRLVEFYAELMPSSGHSTS